ncbi:MAG: cell filamentation protein Fic, partial [Leptonema sp. (in: Bacteria)]|nr:cell filamentation protein Fic [Leptonema sp. (in: bacteria)]
MFLYEAFTKRQLASNTSQLKANYLPLFDPDVYITTEGVRNSRWRILWNGIGNIDYCVIVRKTDVMNAFIEENLLEQVENFAKSLPINLLNRTLAWAYLDETRNSYAIEKEAPTTDKLNRFVEL